MGQNIYITRHETPHITMPAVLYRGAIIKAKPPIYDYPLTISLSRSIKIPTRYIL